MWSVAFEERHSFLISVLNIFNEIFELINRCRYFTVMHCNILKTETSTRQDEHLSRLDFNPKSKQKMFCWEKIAKLNKIE